MNRFLFPRSGEESEAECPVQESHVEIIHFVGNLTFHEFATILSGSCAIASWLISSIHVFRHAANYRNPVQQRQTIRIILLVPWAALFCFLIVWQSQAGAYLIESLDFGCAIALAAFLLLLCDYVLSCPGGFDELFGEGAQQRGTFAGDSPSWLKRIWYGVLQFIPASLIIWLATVITLAVGIYCESSNSPRFAHIWIQISKVVVTTISIVCIFKFYGREKQKLKPHNVFLKFFAFKGIIGLNVLQTLIVNILSGQDVIRPAEYLDHHDISSLPALLLACEMPLFSILIMVSFPLPNMKNGHGPAAGPLTAIIEALNITDLLSAFVRGPMRLVRDQQRAIVRQNSIKISILADTTLPEYPLDDNIRSDGSNSNTSYDGAGPRHDDTRFDNGA